jgi:hypothetical protein
MFALESPPAARLELVGWAYRLVRVFKHDFWAATCLYERESASTPDWPPLKVVVKFGRAQPFWGLPLEWVGRHLRENEHHAYRLLRGVPGVPRWIGSFGATGYAVEYVEGQALDRCEAPPPGFFDRLRELFDAMHERGLAYADANKRSNILVGEAGRPWLVDYQISVRRRDHLPWPFRAIAAAMVRYMARSDIYHLYKHKRRLAPAELTPLEEALSRKRSLWHGLHRVMTGPYREMRRGFLRRQHKKGALQSPTAGLEDYDMPEKDTWRK